MIRAAARDFPCPDRSPPAAQDRDTGYRGHAGRPIGREGRPRGARCAVSSPSRAARRTGSPGPLSRRSEGDPL